jgi:hypothetical protein
VAVSVEDVAGEGEVEGGVGTVHGGFIGDADGLAVVVDQYDLLGGFCFLHALPFSWWRPVSGLS